MKTLDKIARQTHDLRIFTDGERRYGNLLFEICHELVKNGKPGRPKKTFKRGVHVRVKNKGAQAHKKGRKRPKYQSPWKEHPETARTIKETDIHANHAEAFFSALRRKCATFRITGCEFQIPQNLRRLINVYASTFMPSCRCWICSTTSSIHTLSLRGSDNPSSRNQPCRFSL
jgi:hypothetical protein